MPIIDVLPLTGLPVESFLHPAKMHVSSNNVGIIKLFILNVPFRCRRTVPGYGCPELVALWFYEGALRVRVFS